jgi:site-specific recombinase XerD
LSALSELYVYLIEEDKVKINPALNVTRRCSRPEHPRGAVSIATMKQLFPTDHEGMRKLYISQKYICAFLVLRDTGLRPRELIALRWKDWHPELRFFPIMKAIESGTRANESINATVEPLDTSATWFCDCKNNAEFGLLLGLPANGFFPRLVDNKNKT